MFELPPHKNGSITPVMQAALLDEMLFVYYLHICKQRVYTLTQGISMINCVLGPVWAYYFTLLFMQILPTPSQFVCQLRSNGDGYMLLRADSDASLYSWTSFTDPRARDDHMPTIHPNSTMSLGELWQQTQPMGLLDNVVRHLNNAENTLYTWMLDDQISTILMYFVFQMELRTTGVDNFFSAAYS